MTRPEDHDGFARRVLRSFLVVGAGNVVSKVLGVVAIFVALKLVSAQEFGVASIVLAVLAILRPVTELGLGVALVQAKEPKAEQIDALFWLSIALAGGFYLLLFAGAPLIAWFYEEASLAKYLRVQALSIAAFPLFFVSRALLERELAFGRITIVENVSLLVSSILMIVLAAAGLGVWAFVWADVGQRLTQILLCQIFRPYWPRVAPRIRGVKDMVVFSLYATGSRLLYNFYIHADYLVVGKVFGEEAVGFYALAYRVVSDPVKALASVVNQVAYPAFARLQSDRERLATYLFTVARVAMAVIGLLLVIVVLWFEPALRAAGYEQWLGATPLVLVFAPLGIVRSVAPLVPSLLNALGQARLNFMYSSACAVALPAGFVVGAQFGLSGVAWSWVIVYPLVVSILFFFGARALGISMPKFTLRMFSGLWVLVPSALAGAGIFYGLTQTLALPDLPATVCGALSTLAFGGGLTWLRDRENLAAMRATRSRSM